ncbi:MAG: hypothetical protein PPFGHCPK_01362 (plasmid) [Spiroplasma endosymbiont of Drosophila atripex]|nr:MAG: hypothetical protein PPFGHCPK_01362 [Spiroplasma endosymbiont of Drosophila atripex]
MKKWLSILTIGMLSSTSLLSANMVINSNVYNQISYNDDKNDIIYNDINYSFSDWYNGVWSYHNSSSDTYKLLKWIDYTDSWDNFTKKYQTFNFDEQSILKVSLSNEKNDATKLSNQTQNIKINQGAGNTNSIFKVEINTFPPIEKVNLNDGNPIGNYIKVDLNIWHDNENIYFKWFLSESSFAAYKSYFDIKLNKIFFNSNN